MKSEQVEQSNKEKVDTHTIKSIRVYGKQKMRRENAKVRKSSILKNETK